MKSVTVSIPIRIPEIKLEHFEVEKIQETIEMVVSEELRKVIKPLVDDIKKLPIQKPVYAAALKAFKRALDAE